MATFADPKLEQFDAEFVHQTNSPQLEILSMAFGSRSQSPFQQSLRQCEYLRERDYPFFESLLNAHTQREHDKPGPRVLIGQLEPHSVVGKAKNLAFVSSGNRMKSSFYSTMTLEGDDCSMEIWYNLLEDHSSVSSIDLQTKPRRLYEPVYFAYYFRTGRSIYLLSQDVEPSDLRQSAHALDLHPFSIHLALFYNEVEARSHAVARGLDTMLAIERRWLEEPLLRTIDTYAIKMDLQSLHRVARLFITCEHRTARDLSHINKLLRDLDRLVAKTSEHPRFVRLDPYMHERIKDGFHSLRDSCENIVRRMQTRRMRVSNMINLLFNLTSNQDSATTIAMSREMRTDSAAMRTIATLSMFFLPATFISSIFGNNFYALSVNSAGLGTLVASEYWWIYLLIILVLTLSLSAAWVWWIKRRAHLDTKSKIGHHGERQTEKSLETSHV